IIRQAQPVAVGLHAAVTLAFRDHRPMVDEWQDRTAFALDERGDRRAELMLIRPKRLTPGPRFAIQAAGFAPDRVRDASLCPQVALVARVDEDLRPKRVAVRGDDTRDRPALARHVPQRRLEDDIDARLPEPALEDRFGHLRLRPEHVPRRGAVVLAD